MAQEQQPVNDAPLIDGDEDDDDDISDDEDDPLAHLPPYVLARVEKLQDLQATRDEIMQDYLKERAALEKKYEALVQPLYRERAAVVRGAHDDAIAAETAARAAASSSGMDETNGGQEDNNDSRNGEGAADGAAADDDRVQGIPQFWAAAMTHLDSVSEIISEDDVDCLALLNDITCVDRDDGKGFTLTFHFQQPNDYFSNPVLTKSYEIPNLLLSDDEPLIKNVVGTQIEWKPGRSLTHRTVTKKQRGKKGTKTAGQVRNVTKQEEKESFFHWFTAPEMPTMMEEMDEEEAERVEELFDSDYEVAQAFRCHLIPKAVSWFTGQVSVVCPFFPLFVFSADFCVSLL